MPTRLKFRYYKTTQSVQLTILYGTNGWTTTKKYPHKISVAAETRILRRMHGKTIRIMRIIGCLGTTKNRIRESRPTWFDGLIMLR